MKRLLLLLASFLLLFGLVPELVFAEEPQPQPTTSSVLITEIKLGGDTLPPDPPKPKEYVSIFNGGDEPVLLDGWKLEHAKIGFDPLACNTTAWSISKSLSGTLNPGGVLSLSHQLNDNQAGSLRLVQPTGDTLIVHSLVGWGEQTPCKQGESASIPSSGTSLQRYLDCSIEQPLDTGNNATDFFVSDTPSYEELGGQPAPECSEPEEPSQPPLTCEGVVISEVLPNPAGADSGREFIELYNPTTDFVVLDGCGLQVDGSAIYWFTGEAELGPEEHRAFHDTGLTLPNAAGGAVYLLSPTQEELHTVTYQPDLAEDVSWAWFGADEWEATYAPTPNNLNARQPTKPCPEGQERSEETGQCRSIQQAENSLKPCGPGQERNLETNRCRKAVSTQLQPCKPGQTRNLDTNRCRTAVSITSTLVPCKSGQERNPATNRCRKIAGASTLKPCAAGQERSPETNRCRKIAVANTASLPDVHDIQAVHEGNPLRWWIAGGAVAIVAAYGIYEWRRDIATLFAKLKSTTSR